jgi:hypothetical protein
VRGTIALLLVVALVSLAGCFGARTTTTYFESAYFLRVTETEEGGEEAELFALELATTLEGETDAVVGYAPAGPFRLNVEAEGAADAPQRETFMLLPDAGNGVRMQPLARHDALMLVGSDMADVIRELGTLALIAETVEQGNHGADRGVGVATSAGPFGLAISAETRAALTQRAVLEAAVAEQRAAVRAADELARAAERRVATAEVRLGNLVADIAPGGEPEATRASRREASELQLELDRFRAEAGAAEAAADEVEADLILLEDSLSAERGFDMLRAELSGEPMPGATVGSESGGSESVGGVAVDAAEAQQPGTGTTAPLPAGPQTPRTPGADGDPDSNLTPVAAVSETAKGDAAGRTELRAAPPVNRAIRRVFRYNGELFDELPPVGPTFYMVSDAAHVRTFLTAWDGLLSSAGVDSEEVAEEVLKARDGFTAWSVADEAEPLIIAEGSPAEALIRALEVAMVPAAFKAPDDAAGEAAPEGGVGAELDASAELIAAALREGAASDDLRALHQQQIGADATVLRVAPADTSDDVPVRVVSVARLAAALDRPFADADAWTPRDNLTRQLEASSADGRIAVFLSIDRDLQIKQLEPDILGHLNAWWKAEVGTPGAAAEQAGHTGSRTMSEHDPASVRSPIAALVEAELASDRPSAITILRLLELGESSR